jgi:hypothetical protein
VPSGPIDLTGDASHPLSANQSTVAFSATHVAAPPTHIDLTDEVNDMPAYGDDQPQNDRHSALDDGNEVLLDAIINDAPCGSAIVYRVDGEPVAVSPGQHYLLRNRGLHDMSLVEFNLCTQVVQKKKVKKDAAEGDVQTEQQNHPNVSRGRGRPDNLRLGFASNLHPLFHTHDLQLRSKINPWILGGNPPPKPPPLPKPGNPTEAWIRKANAFAAYYLVLFRPFSEDDVEQMSFTWEALCTFMEKIDQVSQNCTSYLHIEYSEK